MKSANLILRVAPVFLLMAFSAVFAQQEALYPARSQAAQYYLGSEDELLIPVNIWGFVLKPGQYMVPNNTDLISLISFAGGPQDNAEISNIRLIRNDPKFGDHVFRINVKKFIETGQRDRMIPVLKPGDTIIVKGNTMNWIKGFLAFFSSLTFLVQIYYLITIAEAQKD